MQSTFAMLAKLFVSMRNWIKINAMLWAVLFLCSSVTVFGLDLASGQRIFLSGVSYVIDQKIGQGASADIYQLHLENDPSQEFVLRSPRFSKSAQANAVQSEAARFQTSLGGFTSIITADPDSNKWLWAPKVFEVPLNPHRRILEVERKLGWDKTHMETVVVTPLAKGSMLEHYKLNYLFQENLQATTRIYEDLLPELRYLIDAKLVHGDIKPGNVLINKNGKAGLSDFEGVVGQGQQTLWMTRNFAAPESNLMGPLSFAADLYSTAKTLLWALLSKSDWERVGEPYNISYSSYQYKTILGHIDTLEEKVRGSSYSDITAELKMLNFIRYALNPDPIKRITQLQKNVSDFKYISTPKEPKMLANLYRQSLALTAMTVGRKALYGISNRYYALTTPKKTDPRKTNSYKDMETSPAFNNADKQQDDYKEIKDNFMVSRFSEFHLANLTSIPIDPAEHRELLAELDSSTIKKRAWAALRLAAAGEMDEKISNILLTETSLYITPPLLTKLYKFDGENIKTVEHIINLLRQVHDGNGMPAGLLGLLDFANPKLVIDSKQSLELLLSKNALIRNYFTKFYIQQNTELKRVTDILVKACLDGNGTLLLDNLQELKPHLTRSQITKLFNSAIDHLSKGTLDSQKVVAQLGTESKLLTSYIKQQHPGYQLNEVTGHFRYRQSPEKQISSCHSFYGK